jgi:hypothetical protein
MDLQLQGYDEARGQQFSAQLLDRVGIAWRRLGQSDRKFATGFWRRNWITIEGYNAQPGEDMEVHNSTVAPVILKHCRFHCCKAARSRQDRAKAPGVVIINEASPVVTGRGKVRSANVFKWSAFVGANSTPI